MVENRVDPSKSIVPISIMKFHHFALPRLASLYFIWLKHLRTW